MMSRVWTMLLVFGLALLIGGAASAQDKKKKEGDRPRKSAEERFKELDKNNDSSLSFDEFKAPFKGEDGEKKAEEIFKKLDKDSDKKLSLDEFKAGRHEKKKEHKEKKQ